MKLWRVWRMGIGEDRDHEAGVLYAPLTDPSVPWTGGQHTALCGAPPGVRQPTAHEPPGEHCTCGVVGTLDARGDLFGEAWRSRDYWSLYGMTWVLGRVEVAGVVRMGAAPDDGEYTFRAGWGRVVDVVYLPRSTWDVADRFSRLHPWVDVELVEEPESALPLISRIDRREAAA